MKVTIKAASQILALGVGISLMPVGCSTTSEDPTKTATQFFVYATPTSTPTMCPKTVYWLGISVPAAGSQRHIEIAGTVVWTEASATGGPAFCFWKAMSAGIPPVPTPSTFIWYVMTGGRTLVYGIVDTSFNNSWPACDDLRIGPCCQQGTPWETRTRTPAGAPSCYYTVSSTSTPTETRTPTATPTPT